MMKFEYRTMEVNRANLGVNVYLQSYNELGAEGWEMVQVVDTTNPYYVLIFFKREVA